MNHYLRFPLCLGLGLCAMVLCAAIGGAAAPPKDTKARKPAERTAPPADPPQSTFTIPANSKEGKDPFFPLRNIVGVASGPKPPTTRTPTVKLVFNGVSGTREKPLAIVNGRTFEKNEEGEIVTANGRLRVRCIDIKQDSVVLEVNGQRQELRLRGAN